MNTNPIKQTRYEKNAFQERQPFICPESIAAYYNHCLNDDLARVWFGNIVPPEFRSLYLEMLNNPDLPRTWAWQTFMVSKDFNPENFIMSPELVRKYSFCIPEAAPFSDMLTLWRDQSSVSDAWQTVRKNLFVRELPVNGNVQRNFAQMVHIKNRLGVDAYSHTRKIGDKARGFVPFNLVSRFEPISERYPFPETVYGFADRDVETLNVEKRIRSRGNLLLIRGMGGVGKTTFLHYLGAWWQTTGFADQVFYFSFDNKPWTRDQIIRAIAERLVPYQVGRVSKTELDTAVCEKLRNERHLVILDDADPLFKADALPQAEQEDIYRFLGDMNKGRTLALVGSRDNERQPAKQIFGDNVYDLSGLDTRSAFGLGNRILKHHGLSYFRQNPDFQEILELLKGHPLAMEEILPRLKNEKPAELLKSLKADDSLWGEDSQSDIILRCVEYIHTRGKDILGLLAPFSSFINNRGLKHYEGYLRKQPALSDLRPDLLTEIIQEAGREGLVRPHPQHPILSKCHPVFSYFLRTYPDGAWDQEKRLAVETGFRQYYESVSQAARLLMNSGNSRKNSLGRILIGPEYENLRTALGFALDQRASVGNLYKVLSEYLNRAGRHHIGLELGEQVMSELKYYPREDLEGNTGAEMVEVIDDIARRQLLFRRYPEAEASYQKALALWLRNKKYNPTHIRRKSGAIYHQLGRVAQEQGRWNQAREYFLKDLQIAKEVGDRRGIALTFRNLFRLWQSAQDRKLPEAVAALMGW